ncbi:hypothetical protein IFM89_035207 [Coptis chinensis]|uniref:RNase H type-1 domain-containing protein n=1 Tax=Coptis chinensis TaxID=261450 RepID=A0A835IKE5_9MAGN|nr:hypothetical protein IFM89_035207 [Coptis chinensis]
MFYEGAARSLTLCKVFVIKQILITAALFKSFSNPQDRDVLRNLGVDAIMRKALRIQSCFWNLPCVGTIKVNTDGVTKGNLGLAAVGSVGRNSNGAFDFVYSRNLGVTTSYVAECVAILEGIEVAVNKGHYSVWVESYSKAVVVDFNTDKIPWQLKEKW